MLTKVAKEGLLLGSLLESMNVLVTRNPIKESEKMVALTA